MNGPAKTAARALIAALAVIGPLWAQAPQTIAFDTIPPQIFGVSPFVIAAQASSGLAVSFASATPAVCKTASVLVMLLTTGTCSITASQGGNSSFSAATPVTRSFAINPADPAGTLKADAAGPFVVGTGPVGSAVGDFNGDGFPDIVATNGGDNTVTVLLGSGSGGFTTAMNSPFVVGSDPISVAVGDFNGDGFQDLAVANLNDSTVTILLGNGSGGFTPATGSPLTVGAEPGSISVGDFNGDGIQDLAVANFSDSTVTVLLGNGSGGFAAASGSPLTVGTNPGSVVVGDFNGDGIEDLATANFTDNTITVMIGNGSGGFTPTGVSPPSGGTGTFSMVAGDFNGDGIQDLATVNFNSTNVTVLLGTGSGGFAPATGSPFTVGTSPISLVVGDFTGTGIEDLAMANSGDSTVTVLLGNGSGGFTAAPGSPFAVGADPDSIVAGNFNGNGVPGVATVNSTSNNVTVLLGSPVTTTSVLSTTSTLTIGLDQSLPLTLTVSDTTPAFSAPSGTATFMDGATTLGTATQTVSPYTFTATGLGLGAHTITATYGGGSGSTGSTSNAIAIQVETAQSIMFAPLSNVNFGASPFTVSATASSGLTVSFASTTPAVCTVSVSTVTIVTGGTCSITASQAGNASFAPASPVTQSFSVTNASQTISFDAIPNRILGISPFVVAAEASSGLGVSFASTTPAVCKTASILVTLLSTGTCSITASQGGNANFSAANPVMRSFTINREGSSSGFAAAAGSPFTAGTNPTSVAAGDFNGDGIPDFAATNSGNNTVTVLLGNGSGGFTAATGSPFAVGSSPYSVVAGDFNGDGILDLATANNGGNTVTVLLGNGSGGFMPAPGSPFTVGTGPVSLVAGDFNGDGIQDLVSANLSASTVTVLLGNGLGGFAAAAGSPFTVGANPFSVAVGDFNGDGIQDLAIANSGGTTVTVLLGNGSGGFTAETGSPFTVGSSPFSVVVGDFNGDGIPDLATANSGDNTVTVLLGSVSGGFTAATGSPFAVGSSPYSVVVGDFNGDGIQDLATANGGDNTVSVLLGNGSGGFTKASASPFNAGTEPVSVIVGDFNQDGLLDLAAVDFGGNSLTVLLGVGTTPQTITFGPLSGVIIGAVSPFTLSATASSGLTVSFASTTPGVCTVAVTTITIVSTGICSITASQAGSTTYAAATPVTQTFTVSSPPPPPPPPPLSITSSGNLGEIALGSSVSQTFTAFSGDPPYTWSATGLPAGLTLNAASGVLGGSPLKPGNASFTVMVTDSAKSTAMLAATLEVLGIATSSSLPNARAGKAYSQLFAAAGGSGTYSFAISSGQSGNVPPGLAFSGSALAGTPTTGGTFNFQVQVADGSGVTASASFSLVVIPGVSITSSGSLSEIAFGSSVADTLAATGGTKPYTWSATGLPAGVTLNASSGALGGSPSQPGNYSFTAQVADAETPPFTATLALTLPVLGLTTPTALPYGSTTAAYSQTFSAAGGAGPYVFSSPKAPPGLSFSGATLSGTPATVGSYLFTVRVTDASGFATSSAFILLVTGPASPLNISGGALPGGAVGTAYSQALTGTGGAPPYTWKITGGAIPAGLSLNGPTGVISGTPSLTGTSSFTAQATDSSGASESAAFTITIAPAPLAISGLPLPNGIAGSAYPLQILNGSGGVGPYTFTIGSGSLPTGLSLTSGEISGTPASSGTSSFSIAMTDSESPPLTISAPTQIAIASGATANLLLSAGSLSFNLAAGATGLPAPASVTVQSSAAQQLLNYSAAATPAVSWLDVTGGGVTAGTTTPGTIGIALDPSALNLGASATPLTTNVVVTCLTPSPCAGQSQTIAVSLSVTAPAPQLTFLTNLAQFSTTVSQTASLSQQVAIRNTGGGSAVIGSATAADGWLTVGGVPASVSAGAPASITLTANPSGLGPGFFRTTVTIQSSGGTITVPVTLEIAKVPSLTLSASGAQFQSTLGSPSANTAGSFQVGVAGGPTLNWTASVLPGAPWLQLSALTTSGTATSSNPGTVSYHLVTSGLTAAQTYYGTIQITAAQVTNSPLNYLVVLNLAGAAALPIPVPQPAGLLFQSAFGASAPPSQTVTVYGSSASGVSYSASASTTDGNSWLTVSPGSGTSSSAAAAGISTVSVTPGTLPAGVYTGTVSYQFAAASVPGVNVTMVISPPGASAACSPTQLVPAQTGLVDNFAQPTGLPTLLSVAVVNNCGAPVKNGQVIATFSNGDPPVVLGLVNTGADVYSGTWTPQSVSGQVTVTTTVTAPGFSAGSASVSGEVVAGAAPLLASGGTLHIFNPLVGGALGQGTVLQIYGSNMSASTAAANAVPLSTTLGGTSVTIGGIPAPLYYVSPSQIDAQLPGELLPGNSYQVIVNADGAISMPGSVQVSAATPGVAAFPNGEIVAQHPDYSLVTEASPAAPGEYLVIYLSGLGLTSVAVADGAASPSPSNLQLLSPVLAPTLTLNGANIPIYFAGLTPGYVGLYQMNFQVPSNTPNGDLQLVVSQGGQTSNSAILPVHN